MLVKVQRKGTNELAVIGKEGHTHVLFPVISGERVWFSENEVLNCLYANTNVTVVIDGINESASRP